MKPLVILLILKLYVQMSIFNREMQKNKNKAEQNFSVGKDLDLIQKAIRS